MVKNKKLIGIAGTARSGKDTAGKYLIMRHNFHRMAFADPLKEAMAATFGLPVEDFHSDKLKDAVHPHWGITRREMLQKGADALRGMFGQDLYIRRWVNSYIDLAEREHVVVTDVRSNAEAMAIRELGGRIVKLEREGSGLEGKAAAHHTEGGVHGYLIDKVIENNGDKSNLYSLLESFTEGYLDAP